MTIDEYVRQFEDKMRTAMEDKYAGYPDIAKQHILSQSLVLNQLDVQKFLETYRKSKYFDKDRETSILEYLLDIKIQVFFIQEVQLGLYNSIIYKTGKTPDYEQSPYMLLKHLSLDQSTIIQSRILWERIMNFIYTLETGKELKGKKQSDGEKAGARSKKAAFSEFLAQYSKWSFLETYHKVIEEFDSKLRNPEIHRKSTLRGHFMKNEPVDSGICLVIINIVLNLWQNIYAVLDGEEPSSRHWNSGMIKLGAAQPKLPE